MFRSHTYKRVDLIMTLKIIQYFNIVVLVDNFQDIKLYAAQPIFVYQWLLSNLSLVMFQKSCGQEGIIIYYFQFYLTTVDHTILCQTLKHICHFSNTAVNLISLYSWDRSQLRVMIVISHLVFQYLDLGLRARYLFLPEICWDEVVENIFFVLFKCLGWRPTHYQLDYGDY